MCDSTVESNKASTSRRFVKHGHIKRGKRLLVSIWPFQSQWILPYGSEVFLPRKGFKAVRTDALSTRSYSVMHGMQDTRQDLRRPPVPLVVGEAVREGWRLPGHETLDQEEQRGTPSIRRHPPDPGPPDEPRLSDDPMLPEPDPEANPLPPGGPRLGVLESGGLPDPLELPSAPGFGFMMMALSDPIVPDDSYPCFVAPSPGLRALSRVAFPPFPGLVISGPPCPIAPPEPVPLPTWACNVSPVNTRIPLAMTYVHACLTGRHIVFSFIRM
jgi:hypothetical protein